MKPRIVIVMDGGGVQHILGNGKDIEIAMIDYDVEGVEESYLIDIPQTERYGTQGATEQALAWTMDGPDEVNPARVDQLFDVIASKVKV